MIFRCSDFAETSEEELFERGTERIRYELLSWKKKQLDMETQKLALDSAPLMRRFRLLCSKYSVIRTAYFGGMLASLLVLQISGILPGNSCLRFLKASEDFLQLYLDSKDEGMIHKKDSLASLMHSLRVIQHFARPKILTVEEQQQVREAASALLGQLNKAGSHPTIKSHLLSSELFQAPF